MSHIVISIKYSLYVNYTALIAMSFPTNVVIFFISLKGTSPEHESRKHLQRRIKVYLGINT